MTTWDELVRCADPRVSDTDVDMARRALDYLCLAQLYLEDDLLLTRTLHPADVAERPSGHWGVCPPVNAVLAALGPYRQFLDGIDMRVLHGAGHAGPSALAQAWLTGALADLDNGYPLDIEGLHRLVTGFRHGHRFGTEITPLLPGHDHLGGQLGPALAISHGMALDAPNRLVIALIGDGECETGATAAAWLGARALAGTGSHGRVLPVVLLNGLRMGGASLLSTLTIDDIRRFFAALGYRAVVTDSPSTPAVRVAVRDALAHLRPVGHGPSTVLVVTVPKGHGAPTVVVDRPVLGTAAVHKTPLRSPRDDPDEFAALAAWLAGYRPSELFGPDAVPAQGVRRALGTTPPIGNLGVDAPHGCLAAANAVARISHSRGEDFGAATTRALTDLHSVYGLRVFSPDELLSNRIHFGDRRSPWVVEVLNEELCHAWAQGYQETGRRAVVVTYEAFAPVAASLLAQQLTQRRLAAAAGRPAMPSIVYLLTSLGWNNTISHANPGLVDIALAAGDPTVRVYTPADPARVAATLTFAVRKLGRCSLIIASKHSMPTHLLDTVTAELRDGYAVWPHVADHASPDLILMSAGDIATRELTTAARMITTARPTARLRYIHVHDLTCLGAPDRHDSAIQESDFADLLPAGVPVLAALPCHATTVHGLIAERGAADRVTLRGWRAPARPMTPAQLLRHAGLDAHSLVQTALRLLDSAAAPTGKEHVHAR
jgi:xylulose-5-phosphate/fructose-6-phosphate phosphoketolase